MCEVVATAQNIRTVLLSPDQLDREARLEFRLAAVADEHGNVAQRDQHTALAHEYLAAARQKRARGMANACR